MKMVTIPAGITWERKGRLSYVCTIRREPETFVVWEWADVEAMHAGMNQAAMNQGALGTCHCGGGMLGGMFGGLGF